jgi:hypothetical protein
MVSPPRFIARAVSHQQSHGASPTPDGTPHSPSKPPRCYPHQAHRQRKTLSAKSWYLYINNAEIDQPQSSSRSQMWSTIAHRPQLRWHPPQSIAKQFKFMNVFMTRSSKFKQYTFESARVSPPSHQFRSLTIRPFFCPSFVCTSSCFGSKR